eukprot:12099318-Alexandrium_andersonii.AAC.1
MALSPPAAITAATKRSFWARGPDCLPLRLRTPLELTPAGMAMSTALAMAESGASKQRGARWRPCQAIPVSRRASADGPLPTGPTPLLTAD